MFGDLAFSVRGADTSEEKESRIVGWLNRERPIMISKSSIMGWGLNFQHCAHIAFVGVTDSFEAYYQAVRRCWRFGQTKTVHVHIFASESEGSVVANLKRKEADAIAMAQALAAETAESVRMNVRGLVREHNEYGANRPMMIPQWLVTEEVES